MKRKRIDRLLLVLPVLALAGFQLAGIGSVPFHPDEASLLYQSGDLEGYLTEPWALAYDPKRVGQLDQAYRALNPALPKYILGLGRVLAGGEPVRQDWRWDQTWEENLRRGALPTVDTLLGSRLANTALLILSLLLILRVGHRIGGWVAGLAAALLLGSNTLILLHARRAMAEGTLVFATSLAVWAFLMPGVRPWLKGLAAGLAFCAKASLFPLVPVGLLSVLWPSKRGHSGGSGLRSATVFSAAALAVILALNPFLWSSPIDAGLEMWRSRQALVREQVRAQSGLNPFSSLDSPGARAAALVAQVFLLPPQFRDVGNYRHELGAAEAAYGSVPGHVLLRGYLGGGISLWLVFAGMVLSAVNMRRAAEPLQRTLGLLGVATAAQLAALLIFVPLPFQRYYLPLMPFVALWSGVALWHLDEMRKGLPFRLAVLRERLLFIHSFR